MTKTFTCLACPVGCKLTVTGEGENLVVTGNLCPRGEVFARDEVLKPVRIVTFSIPFTSGKRLAVKTSAAIAKDKIFDVIAEMKKIVPSLTATVGDILIHNVLNLNANVVVTGILED